MLGAVTQDNMIAPLTTGIMLDLMIEKDSFEVVIQKTCNEHPTFFASILFTKLETQLAKNCFVAFNAVSVANDKLFYKGHLDCEQCSGEMKTHRKNALTVAQKVSANCICSAFNGFVFYENFL